MNVPVIHCQWKKGQESAFIEYWSAVYWTTTKVNPFYDEVIKQSRFSKSDIRGLFDWKNGIPINGHRQKTASVEWVLRHLSVVNRLKQQSFDQEVFDKHFGKMSAIWQIFLLNLIDPRRFPIFDQHVYRTYRFITDRTIVDAVPGTRQQKLELYHGKFIPFFNEIRPSRMPIRRVDNALWTFGRFLKSTYAPILVGISADNVEKKRIAND
jgi:hypothetical protein